MAASDRYAFGDFVLEKSQQRLLRLDGTVVKLTPRLFSALLLFVEHADRLLDKDTLMDQLWPGLVVEENNLSQLVSGLRRALGDDRRSSAFIETVPRRGFRFIAPVTLLTQADAPPAASGPAAPGQRRLWLRMALASGAAAGLAALAWRGWRPPDTGLPLTTLAVLPFKPLLPQERDELLELGMADSLIARLSTVPGLAVRSTSSVLRYAGAGRDPLLAARELDVAWVVDGSLQRRGEQLRVTARLLRVDDGVSAWSDSFDEPYGSVFELQDRISGRVMQALAPRLQTSAAALPAMQLGGTRSTEAYQLYMAAWWRAQGSRADSTAAALALLQQALDIDPNYALAWALLAWVHRRRLFRNDPRPAEVFGPANAALQRAQALAPGLAQVLAGQAYSRYWHDFDWLGAEQGFRRALRANPNEVSAQLGLALLLLTQGAIEPGFVHMRQARELDPMSPVLNTLEASFLISHGRLAEARTRLQRSFAIVPEHGLSYEALGLLHFAEQQPEQGIAALRRSAELTEGSARPLAVLARHLAALGRRDEAGALLAQLLERARIRFVPGTTLAMAHAALGEAAPALAALERAWAERDQRLIFLKDDPSWVSLRSEPRFKALVRSLGLAHYPAGLTPV